MIYIKSLKKVLMVGSNLIIKVLIITIDETNEGNV